MRTLRKTVNILSFVIVLVISGFLFYRYFPEIWGDVVYPLEYRDEIIKASEDFKLEKNLIAAIIYTESHFNPEAKSGVGASGLMQLMPGTAAGVAKNIGMTDYSPSRIFEPAVNIRLGSAYFRSVLDSRNNNIDVALSNYNGGPGVAGKFQIALDRSVLPRETDGFIRKVKSTWQAYDQVYGSDWQGPTKPFNTPEETSFISVINVKSLLSIFFGD